MIGIFPCIGELRVYILVHLVHLGPQLMEVYGLKTFAINLKLQRLEDVLTLKNKIYFIKSALVIVFFFSCSFNKKTESS